MKNAISSDFSCKNVMSYLKGTCCLLNIDIRDATSILTSSIKMTPAVDVTDYKKAFRRR